jgi:hypothetical protein
MHSIGKLFLCFVLLAPARAGAQQEDGRKCTTFDRFLMTVPADIHGKMTAMSVRPERQTSILSPSKRFRIHFDTAGTDMPAVVTAAGDRLAGTGRQFVDSAAAIFDSVWTAEVTTFGFAPPPPDSGEGGGNEYDIYIQDLGANSFGYTYWDETMPVPGTTAAPRYPSYIVIDNDFGRGFRTMGMAGLRSVAAHEFHHAIQVGGYGWWSDQIYFYELSAEAMEPTVFSTSKDYVNDVGTYFKNIENIALSSSATPARPGYERAIWGIFLMKRYGVSIMRQIWESMTAVKPVLSMKTVLEHNGTTLAKEFSEFCYWNYFTGHRADTVRYYSDAGLYPVVNIRDRQTLGTTPVVFPYQCLGFGVNYLQGVHDADTATFIVANVNIDEALAAGSNLFDYQVSAALSPVSGGTQLANGWSAKFSVDDPLNWKFIPLASSGTQFAAAVICYPNPFRPGTSSEFFIGPLVLGPGQPEPLLTIMSSAYDRVYSDRVRMKPSLGSTYVVWDGKNSRGDLVASGVYIYRLSAGDAVVTGKFAVVR